MTDLYEPSTQSLQFWRFYGLCSWKHTIVLRPGPFYLIFFLFLFVINLKSLERPGASQFSNKIEKFILFLNRRLIMYYKFSNFSMNIE